MPYDIEGEKVSDESGGESWEDGWFQGEGGLYARVELDGQMAAANSGKLPVLMMRRAKRLPPPGKKSGGYLGNVAVCEKGSHIAVLLRANVTWGLDFEAETDPDHKLGRWFCVLGQPNQLVHVAINRYDPGFSGTTQFTSIRVDDVPTLEGKYPGVSWTSWFVFTVRAWNITGFIDQNGKVYGTKLKPQGETTTVTVSGAGANPGDPLPIDTSQFLKVRELFLAPGLPKGLEFRLFVYANADQIRQNVLAHEMALVGDLR